jgi:hypothetical protein
MPTQLKRLEMRDGYIYLRYDGFIHRADQMEPENAYAEFLQFFKDNPCDRLLLDCSRVDYQVDIFKEHTFGEMVIKRLFPFKKIAVLASSSVEPDKNLHIENVLYNRGINFRVFWKKDDAVRWVTGDD